MQEGCTVNKTAKYIARKWTLLILLELYKGDGHKRCVSESKDSPEGITKKALSIRLKALKRKGLLRYTSFPMKSEYILTESGLEIINT